MPQLAGEVIHREGGNGVVEWVGNVGETRHKTTGGTSQL
jgi:hypothetical protein